MQLPNSTRRVLHRLFASLGALAALTAPALANTAPYDGTGVIVQGPSCLLYQDDASGQLYNNADAGGYGSFGLGDHVHIVAEQYPCFFPPCSSNACINTITLIEAFGAGQDPSTPFCFGDGSGTACPCANHSAAGAGEGCANSSGSGARLSATGSPFVADDNVVLHVEGARDSQPGVFVQGRTQIETPFRDGLLCMGNPTERLQVVFTDAAGDADSTVSLVTAGAIAPGDTVHYQLWYRDPVLSPCGTGSNLSSGGSLSWQ